MLRDQAYLFDILTHARDAVGYVTGMSREAFLADSRTYNAVIRCCEVIGEAVKRLSPDICASTPEIPWSMMARMRDFLIHSYDRINLDQVWDTVQEDFPELIRRIEPMLSSDDFS